MTFTQARVKAALHYDPETGIFTWLEDTDRTKAGERAGARRSPPFGRRRIQLDGCRCFTNRLAWFYMTGQWPAHEIDHRNRDTGDDRWSNLRPATRKQNNENKRQYRRKNPGTRGVYAKGKKWAAYIRHDNANRYLGVFDTLVEAQTARRAAEDQFFTHHIR